MPSLNLCARVILFLCRFIPGLQDLPLEMLSNTVEEVMEAVESIEELEEKMSHNSHEKKEIPEGKEKKT